MDDDANAEEQNVRERMNRTVDRFNESAQTLLSPIHHHIHFTLQKAYFKCAYECFDRRRRKSQEEVDECVEYCSVPVLKALNLVDDQLSHFQDRLKRSVMVCRDKYELHKMESDAMCDLVSCIDQSGQESTETLPHLVVRLKDLLSICD